MKILTLAFLALAFCATALATYDYLPGQSDENNYGKAPVQKVKTKNRKVAQEREEKVSKYWTPNLYRAPKY
jgi:hypothetical protein